MPSDEEKVRLLRESEVLVLPSSEEGFGIVLLEANAAYTPFVCYDLPALIELARATSGGLIASHRDVDDLASKTLAILENKQLAELLARKGRRAVNARFSWDKIARRIEYIYRKTLDYYNAKL